MDSFFYLLVSSSFQLWHGMWVADARREKLFVKRVSKELKMKYIVHIRYSFAFGGGFFRITLSFEVSVVLGGYSFRFRGF